MRTFKSSRLLVVTPTLGNSEFLDRSIESVMSLGLDIVHVLSVPEGKRTELQARYPHAIVVNDAGKRQGLYGALNSALKSCPEPWDWFTYINDDDRLLPGFADAFDKHVSATRPEPVMYGNVDLIDETDRVIASITSESNPAWIPALLQQGISPLSQQGNTFSREAVQKVRGFDPGYRLCGDLDFWVRVYAHGFSFKHYKMRVGQFRLRKGQLSSNTRLTLCEQAEIVRLNFPLVVSPIKRQIAKLRYRVNNLPKYIMRLRVQGFKTSHQMLGSETVSK